MWLLHPRPWLFQADTLSDLRATVQWANPTKKGLEGGRDSAEALSPEGGEAAAREGAGMDSEGMGGGASLPPNRSPRKMPEGEQCLPGPGSATLPPLTGMALSVLVVLLLAVLYENIKFGKAKLLHHALVNMSTSPSQQHEETDQDSSSSESLPVSRPRLR